MYMYLTTRCIHVYNVHIHVDYGFRIGRVSTIAHVHVYTCICALKTQLVYIHVLVGSYSAMKCPYSANNQFCISTCLINSIEHVVLTPT